MKNFLSHSIGFLLILSALSSQVHSFENESIIDKSQILITNKYAERFCSAKDDHYFEGLENEKTLKYSYFKYIGLQNKEIYSKEIYRNLINQIKQKCFISKKEEKEINEFLIEANK
tara:strand:+ start:1444 stop:1791 length:348 start_codon:yes stop_codon:yes gene_type:complete